MSESVCAAKSSSAGPKDARQSPRQKKAAKYEKEMYFFIARLNILVNLAGLYPCEYFAQPFATQSGLHRGALVVPCYHTCLSIIIIIIYIIII